MLALCWPRLFVPLFFCALAACSSASRVAELRLSEQNAAPVLLPGSSAEGGSFTHPVDHLADAPLVSLDAERAQLRYGLYRDQGASTARNIVPDFSRAGYRGGGVALPARDDIPVLRVLAPSAGDDDDDSVRIQQAIDEVANSPADTHGLRGVVLLRRGHYLLQNSLRITVGGVVLRGEGRGDNGTVLRSTVKVKQGRIIEVGNSEPAVPRAAPDPRPTAIATAYLPVGAMRIEVESSAGYRIGDRIVIVRTPNERWIGAEGIDTARYGWQASDYAMYYERVVTAVHGNSLSLDAPIVDAISTQFGGGRIYRSGVVRIAEVGIEDLRLEGDPQTGIAVRTPDNGPYIAIRFGGVRDSWVRNVSVRYVSHGIDTRNGAHFNTFEDVAYLDPRYGQTEGVRRYAFVYDGNSAFNLTQRCYVEAARHAFVTGARVPGPNVFLDCVAVDTNNDSGPHQRWSTGTLYDNARDQLLRAQNRRASGSGHGWAGAQQMFWNTGGENSLVQAPPFAMNWSVGANGAQVEGKFPPQEPVGIVESPMRAVLPRSLYLQQLQDRLDEAAVIAVATPAQRQGPIWDALVARGGE